jgi:hypothetical protein
MPIPTLPGGERGSLSPKKSPSSTTISIKSHPKPPISNPGKHANQLRKTDSAIGEPEAAPRPIFLPSQLLALRQLSTLERLNLPWGKEPGRIRKAGSLYPLLTKSPPGAVTSAVPMDLPLFSIQPERVVFQNIKPFHSYQVLLRFRNEDQVRKFTRIIMHFAAL